MQGPNYDAFVSYSHGEDRDVARRLQVGIEKYGKRWYRARKLRLFLDEESLAVNPGLWSSIETALAASSWFVLVTSPGARESKGVDRELRWWLENRSPERLLIVLSEGELHWDDEANDFDAGVSDAVPSALLGALDEEPLWVTAGGSGAKPSDDELLGTIISVSTAIQGIPKATVVSNAERERRRAWRWAGSALAALALLLVAAVAAAVIAVNQRDTAEDQERLARSRQLASASREVAQTDLNAGMQLAIQAYRTDENPATRTALFDAATTSPALVRFIDAGAEVEVLAGSGDGGTVVAALADGRVVRWPTVPGGAPENLFELPGEPAWNVSISDDGAVVTAANESSAMIWSRSQGPRDLASAPGIKCEAAGVSPSGRTVVSACRPGERYESPITVTVADAETFEERVAGPGPMDAVDAINVPSDSRAQLTAYVNWAWLDFDTWSGSEGAGSGGAHVYATASSGDGRFLTSTNGAEDVPVWQTDGEPYPNEPDGYAQVPLPSQATLALSEDGSRLAVAGPGQIYVATVEPVGAVLDPAEEYPEGLDDLALRPMALPGQSANVIAWAGNTRLLSARGREVAVWDTGQLDRLAQTEEVPLSRGCELCGPPHLAVSPDGKRIAAASDSNGFGFIQAIGKADSREFLPESVVDFSYGEPIWQPEGEFVAFPVLGESPLPGYMTSGLPGDVRVWPVAPEGEESGLTEAGMAIGASPDGEHAALASSTGAVEWRDLETGEMTGVTPGLAGIDSEAVETGGVALSADGTLLALIEEAGVRIVALPEGEPMGWIAADDYAAVEFAGDRLLIQPYQGDLQIWDQHGTKLEDEIALDSSAGWTSTNPDGTLTARTGEEGAISLEELDSGARLATFRTPAASSNYRTAIAFAPVGETMVALSELPGRAGGALVVRDFSTGGLIEAICGSVGAVLSPASWRSLGGVEPPGEPVCG